MDRGRTGARRGRRLTTTRGRAIAVARDRPPHGSTTSRAGPRGSGRGCAPRRDGHRCDGRPVRPERSGRTGRGTTAAHRTTLADMALPGVRHQRVRATAPGCPGGLLMSHSPRRMPADATHLISGSDRRMRQSPPVQPDATRGGRAATPTGPACQPRPPDPAGSGDGVVAADSVAVSGVPSRGGRADGAHFDVSVAIGLSEEGARMRTGVWLVGARGSVAVTSIVGALALRAGLAGRPAASPSCPRCAARPCPAWADLVFGGHDVVDHPAAEEGRGARRRRRAARRGWSPRSPPSWPPSRRELRPLPRGAAPRRDDAPADRRRPRRVPASGTASTGWSSSTSPPPSRRRSRTPRTPTSPRCDAALAGPAPVLPPSALAAYAAFTAGCAVRRLHPVHRRPAAGAGTSSPRGSGVPYAGHDGKTGETLVKSVLAPMFAMRNLRVRSLVRASTCSAAATAPTSPTRPPTPPRSPASSGCSARRSATSRRAPPASTTSTTSATSRPPGTSSRSAGFLGTAHAHGVHLARLRLRARRAARARPRPAHRRRARAPAAPARCPSWRSSSRTRSATSRTRLAEQWAALAASVRRDWARR